MINLILKIIIVNIDSTQIKIVCSIIHLILKLMIRPGKIIRKVKLFVIQTFKND